MNIQKFWTSQFLQLMRLIKEHYKVFLAAIAVFLFGFWSAFMLPNELKLQIYLHLSSSISNFTLGDKSLIIPIFLNNLRAAAVTLLSGLLIIFPPITVFFSGFSLGIMVDYVNRAMAVSPLSGYLVWITQLPHVLVELPTIVICGFVSFTIGLKIIFNKRFEPREGRGLFLVKILRIFIFVFIPTIFVAAALESYVSTPLISKYIDFGGNVKQKLEYLIVQAEDIQGIGFSLTQGQLNEGPREDLSLSGLYVYNEEIYQEMINTKPFGIVRNQYEFEDKTCLTATLKELPRDKVELGLALVPKLLNVLVENDSTTTLSVIEPSIYKITSQGNASFYSFGSEGPYIYQLSYRGDSLSIFKRLIDLQKKKLVSKSQL